MSEINSGAGRPPLSYSLPAFHPDGYRSAPRALDNLRALGFRWVTLHPTWLVYDEAPPRIRADAPDVGAVVRHARALGLRVLLEPHLDWESTLTGGPYDWRRRMYLDPSRAYYDTVIAPMAALEPDALTLGSELDVSLFEFPDRWSELADRFSTGIALGHKLNHDVFHRGRASIRHSLRAERVRHGAAARLRWRTGRAVAAYFRRLDYAAFSFYPDVDFETSAREIAEGLRAGSGDAPPPDFAVGEFGLGCNDPSKPWHFDASTFQTAADFDLRREYYLHFLAWVAGQPYTSRPVSFWTAGHYDFLGALEQAGQERFRDEALRAAVAEYNAYE